MMAMEKPWKSYDMIINGLSQHVRYNENTVNNLFLPLLRKLTELQAEKKGIVLAFLAAPPATGKSTLLQFLEKLSKENEDTMAIQALGMDGFHYANQYLETHFIERAGLSISLKSIKGAPETFDVDGLRNKIISALQGNTTWPVYDRKIHDVIADAQQVNGQILLLEGNWLLLNEPKWKNLQELADYTLSIEVKPEFLRSRLIQRKIQGGLSEEAALNFYEKSDRLNVERLIDNMVPADEVWTMLEDGDFVRRIVGGNRASIQCDTHHV